MMCKRNKGFSLIELMIVVAIIGILAAIAYPSYQQNVIDSRRAKATGCLLEIQQFMERSYTTNNFTYVGVNVPTLDCVTDLNGFYGFGDGNPPGAVAAQAYTLTAAVGSGPQSTDNRGCGDLTLTEAGQRGVGGGTDPTLVANCWRQ